MTLIDKNIRIITGIVCRHCWIAEATYSVFLLKRLTIVGHGMSPLLNSEGHIQFNLKNYWHCMSPLTDVGGHIQCLFFVIAIFYRLLRFARNDDLFCHCEGFSPWQSNHLSSSTRCGISSFVVILNLIRNLFKYLSC